MTANPLRGTLVYSTQVVLLIALIAVLAGAAGGYFLSRSLRRGSGGNPAEQELQRLQLEQQVYRQRVTEHFTQTAELLSQLASNYRDVHNHLALGARDLCGADAIARLQPIGERSDAIEPAPAGLAVEPPRDYALRSDDGSGTLDEDYGLEKPGRAPLPEPPRY